MGFGASNRCFDGGFTRVDRFLLDDYLLLSSFAGLGPGYRRFNGRFTRVDLSICLNRLRFFRLTRASRSLSRFAGGNRFAVIRFFPGLDHHRLGGIGFFLANARQCGVDRILIFPGRLNGGLLMAFLTGDFFALQSRLTRFETCLGFCGAFFFHGDGINLGLLLTEVLHQRNVAWADPGAGAAFNAVGQIM